MRLEVGPGWVVVRKKGEALVDLFHPLNPRRQDEADHIYGGRRYRSRRYYRYSKRRDEQREGRLLRKKWRDALLRG